MLPGGADAAATFPMRVAAEGAEYVLAELPSARSGSRGTQLTASVRVPAAWPSPGQTLALEGLHARRDSGEGGALEGVAEGGTLAPGLPAAFEKLRAEGASAWTSSLAELLMAAQRQLQAPWPRLLGCQPLPYAV